MNYLSVNNKSHCQQPIVPYSTSESRANLMSFGGPPPTRRKRSQSKSSNRRRSSSRRGGRKNKTRVTKVRLVKGKVSLRIKGYPGVQRLGASQLVRFVPLNKLKAAAKRALVTSGVRRGKQKRHRRRRRHRQNHSSN